MISPPDSAAAQARLLRYLARIAFVAAALSLVFALVIDDTVVRIVQGFFVVLMAAVGFMVIRVSRKLEGAGRMPDDGN